MREEEREEMVVVRKIVGIILSNCLPNSRCIYTWLRQTR